MCDPNNVTIVGIGRLGLCTALSLDRNGYNVVGVDVFPTYVERVNARTLKNPEPKVEEYLKEAKTLKATLSLDEGLEHADLIYILVATPTGSGAKSYDHSHLSRVLADIGKRKVKNKHIVIGCTVLPGYIHQVGRFLIKDCENTSLSYNPEFIAQGAIMHGFENPDMVLIGEGNKEAGDRLEEMYKRCTRSDPMIARMSPESAEITKLSVNCFITTKIAFANTIRDIAVRTPGADGEDILKAVGADSRIGSKYLKPGYGFGGPCFPRDNRALGNYADSVGVDPLIPRATDESNKQHAAFMADEFLAEGKDHYRFDDVAYKPNCPVPIIEESQKLAVAEHIVKAGKKVTIVDRAFIIAEVMKEYGNTFEYEVIDQE